jgi:hypothetical protein
MTRLLEIIVALILVAILAVVAGVLMPSHGHVERSIVLSHNLQHTFDVLNNFRRFSDYSALRAYDPNARFTLSGADYGVGSKVQWQSSDPRVGDGDMEILSSDPETGEIVWGMDNNWRGHNKKFTIDVTRTTDQKLVSINVAYDVDYGWNLIDRYSQLYLHGDPASFIQYSLADLQTLLANVPNFPYGDLNPRLVDTPQQPMLLVSSQSKNSVDDVNSAMAADMEQINAAITKLGVHQTGPRVVFDTDYDRENYSFDIAVPIDSSTLTINGKSIDLHDAPKPKSLTEQNLASASSTPAPAASAAPPGDGIGTFQDDGSVVVDAHVHAILAFGGRALAADVTGNLGQVEITRQELKAFASTHGYAFNEYSDRFYDVLHSDPLTTAEQDKSYTVYLPVSDAPAQTPGQAAEPAVAGSAAAAPASSAASAEAAPAESTSASASGDSAAGQ